MTTIQRTATVTRAAAAVAFVLAFVAGVPILLIAMIGNPVPEGWTLNSPLTDHAVLGLIACLAWIFWAQMTLCLAVEVIAEVRIAAGRPADWLSRVPGTTGGQQALARALVQAVVAVGLTSAVATATPGPWTMPAGATSGTSLQPAHDVTTPTSTSATLPRPPTQLAHPPVQQRSTHATMVEVTKGDSLWSIAAQHLGSGERWREIAALNEGRQMPDGVHFRSATSILPGWKLMVPAPAVVSGTTASETTVSDLITVERGDTLWGLSEEAYGDGKDWPKIFEANRATIEDPDLIFPGQQLRTPGTHYNAPATRPPKPAHHNHPQQPSTGTQEPPAHQAPPTTVPTPAPPALSGEQPPVSRFDKPTDATHPNVTADADGSGALARSLIGSGVFLAGGLFLALIARRRNQFRTRRSGRTIARTPDALIETERTVRTAGSAGGEAAEFLDLALRDLATRLRSSGGDMPEVQAARLTEAHLDLMIGGSATDPPAPWMVADRGTCWKLARDHRPVDADIAAPYPTLVSVGADDDGGTWLIDLEAACVLHVVGDQPAAAGLVRFMAAELATNPWANTVDVALCGVAAELIPLNPTRLAEAAELDIGKLTKSARRIREAAEATGLGVLEGRLSGLGADSWMPSVLLADVGTKHIYSGEVDGVLEELSRLRGRNAIALVAIGPDEVAEGAIRLTVDSAGRLVTPWATLEANRLGHDEATALADLFAASEADAADEPMPIASRVDGTTNDVDVAGALTDDVTDTRNGVGGPTSLLPRPDVEYLAAAATTGEDLAILAPAVTPGIRDRVLSDDATLEADHAGWTDVAETRPKLHLLGPVEVHVAGDSPHDVERRTAYYAELIAYLATRPDGVTPQQMAEAFSMQTNSLHSRIATLRKWLGADPLTEELYLPESTLTAASKARGIPVYQLDGVLSDADLFTRLRARGQARGPAGIEDLVSALRLVAGKPFDQLRPGGYGWLAENPVDHYLTAAIVDVAHIIATHALAENDPELAAWAAERAIAAAPCEDKPRLDLARAQTTLGRPDEAKEYVASEIFNRSDDGDAPLEPSPRTSQVLGLGTL
ncbi:LysM peptidoglycan-binding domain-containing protein [Nocardioides marmoriginsengisoli]|uniref:LysM peptidoglycan-binding domain-containing protein n=1 Tax=Nocardioides marmoriginsengisoli TaxID=661483 RepID=A0A3N0CGU6_9ACTN|nr:LysM peptidoglycan-binding domain-containing protein [Nocardioides marmoriginsengisoli]RNL62682.1 LysM peptidoglycan-binding domain-containing protein [Nocardioides marmoriginsengisoli]